MVRKAEFEDSSFIEAAIELIAVGGPAAATMAAIARAAGAPTGSIYHRFSSRAALLAAVWHQCLAALAAKMLPPLNQGQSEAAVKALIDWATKHPAMARVVLLHREDDLIDGELPTELHKQMNRLNQQLGAGLSALLSHRQKTLSTSNLALANFAIFDGPIAALKPFLRGPKNVTPPNHTTADNGTCRAAALACARASLDLLE
ncbi:MAG: hypothetical protein COB54_04045 [Alphaproteobacteria bacterium]|nr:MAG: hypothetical protein COB54_04045 [Alphaproteobacteria bacterium]